jgi:uncharacterized protein (TIRG00374 family)
MLLRDGSRKAVKMTLKNAFRVLSFFIGVFFIFLAFSKISWQDFINALRSVKLLWVVASAAALMLSMYSRSLRWHSVTGLPGQDRQKVWEAACIGYLGGIIYPARAGEIIRMLRLQQLSGLGAGLAIGSALIDRIFDCLALCCMLLALIFTWHLSAQERQGFLITMFVVLIVTLSAVVFIRRGHRLKFIFDHINSWGRVGKKVKRWYDECLHGLQILRSPTLIGRACFYQLLVSFADILACLFLMYAFGWDLPWLVSLVVLVYITAALSLPSTPGYVGVYQVATIYALKPSGIDASSAVAYGTVLQVMTLILFISVGAWAYFSRKPIADVTS